MYSTIPFNPFPPSSANAGGGGGGYVLPVASADTLGGVKVGTGLAIDANGVLSNPNPTPYVLPVASDETLGGVKSGNVVNVDASGNMGVNVTTPASNDNYSFAQDSNGKVTITKTTGAGVVSTIECLWNETQSARNIDDRFTIAYGGSGPWRVKLLVATIDYPIDTEWTFPYGNTPTVPTLIFENEIVTDTLNNVINDILRRVAILESEV